MGTTAILLGICFDNSDGLPLERVQIAYCSACIATPFCPASGCKFCACRPYQLLGSDKCVVMNDLGYICMLDLTARISQRGLEQCPKPVVSTCVRCEHMAASSDLRSRENSNRWIRFCHGFGTTPGYLIRFPCAFLVLSVTAHLLWKTFWLRKQRTRSL